MVEAFFRGSDVADAIKHLVKVIRASIGVLESLIVHGEAFEEVFLEHGGGPAAKLDATG